MHTFFHFLVTGELAASQNVFCGPNRLESEQPDQEYMEDASTPKISVGRGFQWCGWQCANGYYRATLLHFSTIVLGILFKQLVSTGPKAFHYNGHSLLLSPSIHSVPKLALLDPKEVSTSLFY
jgi:hypothetical protein